VRRILTVDGDDPPIHFGRRAWPPFRVIDVAHLGSTILCAFEQRDPGWTGKTLVWTMDALPSTDDVTVVADIVAMNLLEDLAVYGSAGWPQTILVPIGALTFLLRDLRSPSPDGDPDRGQPRR
jgi:hypothetical protein